MRIRQSCLGSLVSASLVAAVFVACSGSPQGSGFSQASTGSGDSGRSGNSGSSGDNGNSGNSGSSGNDNGNGNNSLGSGNTDAGTPYIDGGVMGDGPIDTTPSCDMSLAIDDPSAASFANAIGICTTAAASGYGLVDATYSNGFGSSSPPQAGQWGLLPGFGSAIMPREGSKVGAISSGYARNYDDDQGVQMSGMGGMFATGVGQAGDFVNSSPDGPRDGQGYPTGVAPSGYPQSAQGCPQSMLVNDMVDVKLTLKAPPNATGFQFDFDFYSSEWPNFVCSDYNDAFVAYVTSNETTGNVSFDSNHNPIAVNANFFNRCTNDAPLSCMADDGTPPSNPSLSNCSAGTGELQGTGFADLAQTTCGNGQDVNATLGGATGWLTTSAPIAGGEQFTIDFMIWDAGDGLLDSLAFIDNFQWIGGTEVMEPSTQRPPQ